MVTNDNERWKVICPSKPNLTTVGAEKPGPLCPICKKMLGSQSDECHAKVSSYYLLLYQTIKRQGRRVTRALLTNEDEY